MKLYIKPQEKDRSNQLIEDNKMKTRKNMVYNKGFYLQSLKIIDKYNKLYPDNDILMVFRDEIDEIFKKRIIRSVTPSLPASPLGAESR